VSAEEVDHLSYLPFSGSVLGQLADELKGYTFLRAERVRARRRGDE